ncbi:MAG: glycoside hydrolase family 32 protein [Bacteroidales bacterium]|nr:glycoside hydrolase family 32 protein [Bacteroidales bacterium]
MKPLHIIGLSSLLALAACSDNDVEEVFLPAISTEIDSDTNTETVVNPSGYDEAYRPQFHYSPAQNWINDPNGLVYLDGTYHMFYQYNPYSADWGNMSWGQATSTDLIHWEEKAVVLTPDALGDVFSGCCVIDKNNTAGFGANAMIAIYTANGDHQQQALAYSTDGGNTFERYANNPIISNTDRSDFRDPKVFWHEATQRWIMALACGYEYKIEFWSSTNLKSWQKLSDFSSPIAACNLGQWECPDLISLDYNGSTVWVLIVSVNPGGPNGGSGTMYFVGDFDGSAFTADSGSYPKWIDYGPDNYAGVTWSNLPNDRKVLIGWMNNWNYAGASPVSPWRSAMTLPRELSIVEFDGELYLSSKVVSEIDNIAGEWATVENGADFPSVGPCQLQATIPVTESSTLILSNDKGEQLELEINPTAGLLLAKRNSSTGETSFSSAFSLPSVKSLLNCDSNEIVLNIYIDQSSVEILSSTGLTVSTLTVYPSKTYHRATSSASFSTLRHRSLSSIWN